MAEKSNLQEKLEKSLKFSLEYPQPVNMKQ